MKSEKRIVFQTGSFVTFASMGVEFALQTVQNFFNFKKGMVIKMKEKLKAKLNELKEAQSQELTEENVKSENEPKHKVLWLCLIIAAIAVTIVWIALSPRPEHIEDTNGADNYELQQITEFDVIENKMGSVGTLSQSEVAGGDYVKYSSKKFTGVYLIDSYTIFKGSAVDLFFPEFHVKSGNFTFYAVLDGEIVGKINGDEFGSVNFTIDHIEKTGTLEYFIACESANFTFTVPAEF